MVYNVSFIWFLWFIWFICFFMVYMDFNVRWCWKMRGNPILAPGKSVWMIKYQHDNVMMVMVMNMIVMIMVMMVMFN